MIPWDNLAVKARSNKRANCGNCGKRSARSLRSRRPPRCARLCGAAAPASHGGLSLASVGGMPRRVPASRCPRRRLVVAALGCRRARHSKVCSRVAPRGALASRASLASPCAALGLRSAWLAVCAAPPARLAALPRSRSPRSRSLLRRSLGAGALARRSGAARAPHRSGGSRLVLSALAPLAGDGARRFAVVAAVPPRADVPPSLLPPGGRAPPRRGRLQPPPPRRVEWARGAPTRARGFGVPRAAARGGTDSPHTLRCGGWWCAISCVVILRTRRP